MDRIAGPLRSAGRLYPAIDAFDRRQIDMGDGHRIHVEQFGAPEGMPVMVLHGGPGGGSSPFMARFFNPARWRVVLHDQRGCGRSRPSAAVAANTTAHLLDDIEAIRETLGLGPVWLFGGSWGATLALAQAQRHPEAVLGLILRGVFLGRRAELDWFYRGGAARFFPDLWQRFLAPLPPEERADPIAAYHRRLFCGDVAAEAAVAQPWLAWENALAGLRSEAVGGISNPDYARTFARLECHYFANDCFLEEGQLLAGMPRMAHLPGVVVQGRYDMVCPPHSAWELAQAWPAARLEFVPASGHALTEPAIAEALVRATDAALDPEAIRP